MNRSERRARKYNKTVFHKLYNAGLGPARLNNKGTRTGMSVVQKVIKDVRSDKDADSRMSERSVSNAFTDGTNTVRSDNGTG